MFCFIQLHKRNILVTVAICRPFSP